MRIKKIVILSATIGLLGVGSNSFAANATADLNITAELISTLSIRQVTPMAFGNIAIPAAGDPALSATTNSGEMEVDGHSGTAVTVSWPTTAEIKNGSDTLVVAVAGTGAVTNGSAFNLPSSGKQSIPLKGSVDVASDAKVGTYSGTLTLTAAYT